MPCTKSFKREVIVGKGQDKRREGLWFSVFVFVLLYIYLFI